MQSRRNRCAPLSTPVYHWGVLWSGLSGLRTRAGQPATGTSSPRYLNVVLMFNITVPAANPTSSPDAVIVWKGVAFVTVSVPGPTGSAIRIEAGIVSCPALDGPSQKERTVPADLHTQ